MTTLETIVKQDSTARSDESSNAAMSPLPFQKMLMRQITEDDVCILTFDRPNSHANLFDRRTLEELNEHLTFVDSNSHLKGLIFTSAKSGIFVAGADIRSLAGNTTSEEIQGLIQLGQAVFQRVTKLSIPVIAAIHGACVGGGYELCLACDRRIASTHPSTKIGLPETQLGIIPAWGGASRLPRLIGVHSALDIILGGKLLSAKPALRRGLVDALAPPEKLLDAAMAMVGQLRLAKHKQTSSWRLKLSSKRIVAAFMRARARGALLKKTRGHYPALLKALDVVTRGVSQSLEASMRLEREAILQLAQTEACQNLIRLFFLQERSKKLRIIDPKDAPAVHKMAVIGAGIMGAGIAQWASSREIPVILKDLNSQQVGKGMCTIAKLYQQGVKRQVFSPIQARAGMDRIFPVTSEVPMIRADLVLEAAVERMESKKQIFSQLDRVVGPQTILATNTSALSIAEIADVTTHPERVVGMHFFNPVHRMQLVEIVVSPKTSDLVTQRAIQFVQKLGKLPVVVKDSPGFLVNRILMPYLVEAGRLFEQGARIRDIDNAMLDFGMPMGPLRLIDEVGLDVALHVARTLEKSFPHRLQSPSILEMMIEKGLLGRKVGAGFYLNSKGRREPSVNHAAVALTKGGGGANWNPKQLQARMVLLMINEAARCLEERIVEGPEDVDFGMVMGTGFAPFLGGPLRYADFIGVEKVVGDMTDLSHEERRFEPCCLLLEMAKHGKYFYHERI